MDDPLERWFLKEAEKLWDAGTPLVVALSGGIDSMALYALLEAIQGEWPCPLIPVHVNHQLRPEAAADAAWLQAYLARHFQRSLRVVAVQVAPQSGESLEMAARRARYAVLFDAARDAGARVVVAHQKDDQAETVLMRVLTGTGVRGLQAMRPVRGPIVRPLLAVRRGALEQYLRDRHLEWREDASNRDPAMLRNRLRHQVMPGLERLVNPQVIEALAALADHAAQEEEALDFLMAQYLPPDAVREDDDGLVLRPGWQRWPQAVASLVLRRFAARHGLRLAAIHLDGALSGNADWPGGWQAVHGTDGSLEVRRASVPTEPSGPARLPRQGALCWGAGTVEVKRAPFAGTVGAGWMVVDPGRWPELWIRAWRQGDRMHPLGLQGRSKKLQDIWVDAKVPGPLRSYWPILTADPDHGPILGIPGILPAEEARMDPGQLAIWVRFQHNPH
ncbi:MAG: tRNA lysidine(34) synthetase TilS [Firmicutes bacterium]|nr:tRNA lysidine(34) synthetase TilS [Bacillota bacterium]